MSVESECFYAEWTDSWRYLLDPGKYLQEGMGKKNKWWNGDVADELYLDVD